MIERKARRGFVRLGLRVLVGIMIVALSVAGAGLCGVKFPDLFGKPVVAKPSGKPGANEPPNPAFGKPNAPQVVQASAPAQPNPVYVTPPYPGAVPGTPPGVMAPPGFQCWPPVGAPKRVFWITEAEIRWWAIPVCSVDSCGNRYISWYFVPYETGASISHTVEAYWVPAFKNWCYLDLAGRLRVIAAR